MKTCLLCLLFLVSVAGWAQKPVLTFRNPTDSSTNYYLTVRPVGIPKGLLVVLPGFGGLPEGEYMETDIPNEAARRGLITIIATLQQGFQSFYVDDASQQTLDAVIQEVQSRYKVADKPLYIGGFSLGGSGAVRYAERAAASTTLPKPRAVFAIDPPLDFERLYESMMRVKRQSKAGVAVNEATFFTERMRQEFGGEPATHRMEYALQSPYCYSDTTNQNAKLLLKTPVCLICEPDISWQMDERNRDLHDLNTLDCVGLINYLRLAGNKKAVFFQTTGKGYRKQPKTRNPHSWSIADPKATIDWLLRF
ncbi:alpha/beta hydrolase [Spirosoma areae]